MLTLAARFQSFKTKKDLNNLIKDLLKNYGRYLRKSCKALISFFARHSINVLGVSFPSLKYILDKSQLSRATYYRAIHTLQCIGFMKVIEVGGERFYQIQPKMDTDLIEKVLVRGLSEIVNDNEHETVEKQEETKEGKDSETVKSSLTYPSFSARKNISEYIKQVFPTIGYDWLGVHKHKRE